MATLGDKARFAIRVGPFFGESDSSREVDVWAAGRYLTCDDNNVNVPFFAWRLQDEVTALLQEPDPLRTGRPYPERAFEDNHRALLAEAETGERGYWGYRFMSWGPTSDNVLMHLFREGGKAFLVFHFARPDHHEESERGQVFVAELPERELALILHEMAWALMKDWSDRTRWR